MSNNKKVEKKECQKCLHYEMCLDNFRKGKAEGLWELTDEKEYFAHADECDFCAVGYCKQSEGENVAMYPSSAFECSECHWQDWDLYTADSGYNFCPNCGAKMKGGESNV